MATFVSNPTSLIANALYDPVSGNALSTSTGLLVLGTTTTVPSGTQTTTIANPYVQTCAYTGISTNGTYVVKSGSGVYFGLNVFTAGASSNTIAVYDGTASSANLLQGTLTNQAAGAVAAGPSGVGIRFTTGLTLIMATGTAATGNVLWD